MSEMIYNQHRIPKKEWRYGLRSSAATGCGWIATYNALKILGYYMKPEQLIRYYTRQLPVINGNFGTFLFGPAIFFKRHGFQVRLCMRRRKFDELVRENEVGILFYRWRRKWRLGSHFVTVQYKEERFVGYNTFRNSEGPDVYGRSLEDFLKQQKYFGCVLIAVKDRK